MLTTNHEPSISDYSDSELKKELEKRGYYTHNLWVDDDVQRAIDDYNEDHGTNYELDQEEKMFLLDEVIGDDADHSSINEDIAAKVKEYFEEEDDTE